MNRLTLTKAGDKDGVIDKGEWRGGRCEDGHRTATVACPRCGRIASLSNHTIFSDGAVSPSLVCPRDCGFHEFVQLADWEE